MLRALGSRSTRWWRWSTYRSPDILPGVRDAEGLQVLRGQEPRGRGALSEKVLLACPRGPLAPPTPSSSVMAQDQKTSGTWLPRRLC